MRSLRMVQCLPFPLLAAHSIVKVHFDQVPVAFDHHTYVKYFDVVFDGICLAVVDSTLGF